MVNGNDTSTKLRILEAMKDWDEERLKNELEFFINATSDEKLEEQFFDDIATEEEHKAGKLVHS